MRMEISRDVEIMIRTMAAGNGAICKDEPSRNDIGGNVCFRLR